MKVSFTHKLYTKNRKSISIYIEGVESDLTTSFIQILFILNQNIESDVTTNRFRLNLTNTLSTKQLFNATLTKVYTKTENRFQPTHKKEFRIKPDIEFRIIPFIDSINIELS